MALHSQLEQQIDSQCGRAAERTNLFQQHLLSPIEEDLDLGGR